jgi:hypothetical protein
VTSILLKDLNKDAPPDALPAAGDPTPELPTPAPATEAP